MGESKRNLTYRFAEHKGISVRTDRPLSHPPHSAIRDHAVVSGHPIEKCDFNILSKARSHHDIKLLESIYIKQRTPNLNSQGASIPLQILK